MQQGGSAGAGASTGGAGSAGSDGGEAGAPEPKLELNFELVDDVETHFPSLLVSSGRNGFWFIAHDDSGGSVSPLEAFALDPVREGSHYAARLYGSGFTRWGAMLGFTLKSPLAAYDATAYCGVRFFAKGKGEGWAMMITDSVSDPEGGVCDPDAFEPATECYDHFGARFQPSEDWAAFEFAFDELALVKGYTGQVRPFESSAMYAFQFVFESATGADFELLIDDVAFVPSGGCASN
jgi:hypothetical protein